MTAYKRVLLKLSGEALQGKHGQSIDPVLLRGLAEELKTVRASGVQLALVVGGGNIFRGMSSHDGTIRRVTADYIGMLATVVNGLALADTLEFLGAPAVVQSAVEMPRVCELTNPLRAIDHLEHERIVIFSGGTGNPYFTTDSTAALRAAEINADVVLKGTKVDGIYSCDPVKNHAAVRFDTITYDDILSKQLQVMDMTAVAMCRENHLPIIVFNMTVPGNIQRVLRGEAVCTRVVPV